MRMRRLSYKKNVPSIHRPNWKRQARLLESLESRLLLAAASWVGPTTGGQWNIGANWDTGNVPNATTDTATIPITATIELTSNVTLQSLTIQGGTAATLQFDNSATLSVNPTTGGTITLNQLAGLRASLTIKTNNTSGIAGVVKTGQFNVTGDMSGSSGLTVNANITVNVTSTIETTRYASDIRLSGNLTAPSAIFGGPDLSTGAQSTININNGGNLSIADLGLLQIGGNGITQFTDAGTVATGTYDLLNKSTMTIDAGNFSFTGSAAIGNANFVPRTFVVPAGITSGTGATINLHNGASITHYGNIGNFNVSGGDGVKINIDSGSTVNVRDLFIGSGDAGKAGPDVTFSLSTLRVVGNLTVGEGYVSGTNVYSPGKLELHSNTSVTVTQTLHVETVGNSNPIELLIDDGSKLRAGNATVGVATGVPAMGNVDIEGGPSVMGARLIIDGTLTVGDGHLRPPTSILYPLPDFSSVIHAGIFSGIEVDSSLVKKSYAVITGLGGISVGGAPMKPIGLLRPDIIPGEYYVFDQDGNPEINPSADISLPNANGTLGALTITGNFDATQGLTLDTVLGNPARTAESGESEQNVLAITGTAKLGGNLTVTVANGISSTSYQNGDSFTILTTAAAGLTGEFTNLPDGFYDGDGTILPTLASGLNWWVHYTNSAVILKVMSPALPTATILTMNGIQGATTPVDLGGPWGGATVSPGNQYFPNDDLTNLSNLDMGGLLSGSTTAGLAQDISGGSDFTFDNPDGAYDDSGFYAIIYEQLVGTTLRVAIINSPVTADGYGWGLDRGVVLFYGEATFTPRMTSLNVPNMLTQNDVNSTFNNTGFTSFLKSLGLDKQIAPATDYAVAAYGGSVTVDMSYTIQTGASGGSGYLPNPGANLSITFVDPNSGIMEISDGTSAMDFQPWDNSGFATFGGSFPATSVAGSSITVDQTNEDLPLHGLDIGGSGSTITVSHGGFAALWYAGVGGSLIATNGAMITTTGVFNNALILQSGTTLNIYGYESPDFGALVASSGTNLILPVKIEDASGNIWAAALYVDGQATVAGDLFIQVPTPITYTAGMTFVLLRAAGGLAGQFLNLPAGDYFANPALPILPAGDIWRVSYTSSSLTMQVISTSNSTHNGTIVAEGDTNISLDGTNLDLTDGGQTTQIAVADVNSLTIYTGSDDDTITIDNSSGNISLTGGINIQGTGNVTLIISGGSMVFNTNAGANAPHLTLEASSNASLTFNTAQTLAGLILDGGTTVTIGSSGTNTLTLQSLSIAGATGAWTANLNLNDNKLVVEAATNHLTILTVLQAEVNYGRTHSAGITDSALPGAFGVAVVDNAILNLPTFAGISVDSGGILISQELLGDANIDGHVDLTDLSTMLNNFGTATASWLAGNFAGDTTVDLTDLSDVLNYFGSTNSASVSVSPESNVYVATYGTDLMTQTTAGQLQLEIAGGTTVSFAVSQHLYGLLLDAGATLGTSIGLSVYVNGNATLASDLLLSTLTGITPSSFSIGDSFTLVSTTGNITGEFASISGLPALDAGLNWEIIYTPTTLTAVVVDQYGETFMVGSNNLSIVQNTVIGNTDTVEVSDGTTTVLLPRAAMCSLFIDASGVSGNVLITGNADCPNLMFDNGSFEITSGNSVTASSDLILNAAALVIDSGATLNWTGGFIDGAVTNYGTLNVSGNASWIGYNIINQGIVNWYLADGSNINQFQGLVVIHGDTTIDDITIRGMDLEVASGTLSLAEDVWTGGNVNITLDAGATLDWGAASLWVYVNDPVAINNYGTINYEDGSHVEVDPGASFTVNNYGTINGTLQVDYN